MTESLQVEIAMRGLKQCICLNMQFDTLVPALPGMYSLWAACIPPFHP